MNPTTLRPVAALVVGTAPYLRVQYVAGRSDNPHYTPPSPPPAGYVAAGPWQILLFAPGDGILWARVLEALPAERERIDRERALLSGVPGRLELLAKAAGVPAEHWRGIERAPRHVLRRLCQQAGIHPGRSARTVGALRAALTAWAEEN